MKLSLSRFIHWTSTLTGGELREASANADPLARPMLARPPTRMPARTSAPRKAAAAARAGSGLMYPR